MSLHPIQRLKSKQHLRKDGWLEEILRVGTVKGDYVELTDQQWAAIRASHHPLHLPEINAETPHLYGLGDLAHWAFKPIAKLLKKEFCAACSRRRRLWNEWGWRNLPTFHRLLNKL